MSKKVEEYIKNYTKRCSNEDGFDYVPWLTPDHARSVAQIARDEVIEEAVKWLRTNSVNYLDKCNNPTYMGGYFIKIEDMVNDLKKAMEDKI